MSEFVVSKVVWAKCLGWPWWPAVVVNRTGNERKEDKLPAETEHNRTLMFFNYENMIDVLNVKFLLEFTANMDKLSNPQMPKKYAEDVLKAAQEACEYLHKHGSEAERTKVTQPTFKALTKWKPGQLIVSPTIADAAGVASVGIGNTAGSSSKAGKSGKGKERSSSRNKKSKGSVDEEDAVEDATSTEEPPRLNVNQGTSNTGQPGTAQAGSSRKMNKKRRVGIGNAEVVDRVEVGSLEDEVKTLKEEVQSLKNRIEALEGMNPNFPHAAN